MTPKERMLTAMSNRQPDRVPVSPDTSNMIPCRLTGKPFWDIYLYRNPPLWKAYIDCVRHFGFDGWLPSVSAQTKYRNCAIVKRTAERIILQGYDEVNGKRLWHPYVTVFYVADPPTHGVPCEKLGLPREPHEWEDFEDPAPEMTEEEVLKAAQEYMGDDGVVGVHVAIPGLYNTEQIYEYYDNPHAVRERARQQEASLETRMQEVITIKPDFILTGFSGCLTFQTPAIFCDLGLPSLQRLTRIAKNAGIPTQVHSCGPERALVEICAKETDLSSINPLERPPMGDCDLAEIKRLFGRHLSLMGNLHTTEHMLFGTPATVLYESRRCIEVAAEGGGFILSTGDQCGRDTPDENIYAMIEAVQTYGVY
ncbi:MAG: uroporphyrinogen decarboxylase family protein [Candidatus Zipacnadales bacterium]